MYPTVFRERSTNQKIIEELSEEEIVRRYRLNRAAIYGLYEVLEPYLQPLICRSHAVPGIVKLLCSLHFFATGSFQKVGGIYGAVSQLTFPQCLGQVLDAIHSVSGNYINFPTNRNEWNTVKRQFYCVSDIPNVLGAIDCTHVAFNSPLDKEHIFRNRKGYHSLNIQIVCDANMNIRSIVSGFPCSSHDAYVLKQSGLYADFQSGQMPHGCLLGDAGYLFYRWLMTPIPRPCTRAESAFNEAHVRVWSVNERSFGVVKSHFRCLDKSGGNCCGSLQSCLAGFPTQ
uniref:Putative nuclease HARBI1 n=1 Tax=Xenopus tropicalis TaxID=8364 RepID=A0A803JI78_XENTR